MIAAEEYVERWLDPEDEKSYEVYVKNYQGVIKKVTVQAEVRIDLTSELEDIQEEEIA